MKVGKVERFAMSSWVLFETPEWFFAAAGVGLIASLYLRDESQFFHTIPGAMLMLGLPFVFLLSGVFFSGIRKRCREKIEREREDFETIFDVTLPMMPGPETRAKIQEEVDKKLSGLAVALDLIIAGAKAKGFVDPHLSIDDLMVPESGERADQREHWWHEIRRASINFSSARRLAENFGFAVKDSFEDYL